MTCPFLRKMNVKYCGLCRLKMIPLSGSDLATEHCSGRDYATCPLAREHHADRLDEECCPSLCVRDVHYCDLAPVRKLIPCNQTSVSRCTDDGHRYCQLYLAMTDPRGEDPQDAGPASEGPADADSPDDSMFALPGDLALATNHMWLDPGDGRTCHVGVDAFFTHALGRIDEVIYPQRREGSRPAVRFRAGGVDFDLTFPNQLSSAEINAHLVVDPGEVLRDPYGRGWIFEGESLPAACASASNPLERNLMRGKTAELWLRDEQDRLDAFVHAHAAASDPGHPVLVQDGGRCRGGLADVLDRRSLVRLHTEFFSYHRGRAGA